MSNRDGEPEMSQHEYKKTNCFLILIVFVLVIQQNHIFVVENNFYFVFFVLAQKTRKTNNIVRKDNSHLFLPRVAPTFQIKKNLSFL